MSWVEFLLSPFKRIYRSIYGGKKEDSKKEKEKEERKKIIIFPRKAGRFTMKPDDLISSTIQEENINEKR